MYQLWPQAKVPSWLIFVIFVVKSTMFLGIRNIHLILRKYHSLSSLPPHSLHFSFYLGPAYFFKKSIYFFGCVGSWDLHCIMWDLPWWHTGSPSAVRGPSRFEAHVTLVPQPGVEPASPALQYGFLTTGTSPGKSPPYIL